jgi:phosphatidylserine decarboxylase
MLANFFVPILDDGWRFIAIFAAITFVAALTGAAWLFWPLFVLTLWSIYFFRDPSRGVPQDDDVLVAPADGLVQMVVDAVPPAELGLGDQPLTRVSIFLSVFDVHINRTPCAGTVDVVAYRPGKYLNAAADKASEDNERMAIALRRADGRSIGCVQIAGWVARRIVCYIKPGRPLPAARRAIAGGGRPAHDRRRDRDGGTRPG